MYDDSVVTEDGLQVWYGRFKSENNQLKTAETSFDLRNKREKIAKMAAIE